MDKNIAKMLLIVVALFFQSPIYAESASISDIDVFNTGKRLVLDASLQDGFSDDVIEAIDSGVPIGITYTVVLKKKTPFFVDKRVVTHKIKIFVKYDTLKEEYKLTENDGMRIVTKFTDDYDEMLDTMTQLEAVHLIYTRKLSPDNKYYVKVKAELSSERTWFPFNYILMFIPFLNFDTPWENSSSFTFK